MAEIGEIKRGKEIGQRHKSDKFVWQACKWCGKERWVGLTKGEPMTLSCHPCATKLRKAIRGENHQSWGGGRLVTSQGYIRVWIHPDDFFYSMAMKAGYILDHRLVMAKSLGRCLNRWENVHHKIGLII